MISEIELIQVEEIAHNMIIKNLAISVVVITGGTSVKAESGRL